MSQETPPSAKYDHVSDAGTALLPEGAPTPSCLIPEGERERSALLPEGKEISAFPPR